MRNVTLWIVVGSAICGAIVGIVGILNGDLPAAGVQLIFSCLTIFVIWSLAFLCFLMLDRSIVPGLMKIAIGACWLSGLSWLFAIWFGEQVFKDSWQSMENFLRIASIVNILAVWSIYIGILYWLPVATGSLVFLRRVTLSVASCFAGLLILFYLVGITNLNGVWIDLLGRLMGMLGLAGFGLTIVMVVMSFVVRARNKNTHETMSERFMVEVICPRCDTNNKIKIGTGKCSKCLLRIRVEIEEPHCECGYAIYRLASDRCPECGREIPPADRWLQDPSGVAP